MRPAPGMVAVPEEEPHRHARREGERPPDVDERAGIVRAVQRLHGGRGIHRREREEVRGDSSLSLYAPSEEDLFGEGPPAAVEELERYEGIAPGATPNRLLGD